MGFLGMSSNLGSLVGAGAMAINPTAALSIGTALADTGSQWFWNNKNFGLQGRTYDYNKDLQAYMISREDNSVQRRVADLKAAGLSPVLAAGQGAGTGPVIQTNTPQGVATTVGDKAGMLMSLLRMEADISKTYAENQLIDLQKSKVPYEIANLLSQTGKNLTAQGVDKASAYNTYKSAELTKQKIRQEKVASGNVEDSGVSNTGMAGQIINAAVGAIKKAENSNLFNLPNAENLKLKEKVKEAPKKRTAPLPGLKPGWKYN